VDGDKCCVMSFVEDCGLPIFTFQHIVLSNSYADELVDILWTRQTNTGQFLSHYKVSISKYHAFVERINNVSNAQK